MAPVHMTSPHYFYFDLSPSLTLYLLLLVDNISKLSSGETVDLRPRAITAFSVMLVHLIMCTSFSFHQVIQYIKEGLNINKATVSLSDVLTDLNPSGSDMTHQKANPKGKSWHSIESLQEVWITVQRTLPMYGI